MFVRLEEQEDACVRRISRCRYGFTFTPYRRFLRVVSPLIQPPQVLFNFGRITDLPQPSTATEPQLRSGAKAVFSPGSCGAEDMSELKSWWADDAYWMAVWLIWLSFARHLTRVPRGKAVHVDYQRDEAQRSLETVERAAGAIVRRRRAGRNCSFSKSSRNASFTGS